MLTGAFVSMSFPINDFFDQQSPTPLTYLTTINGKRLYLKHDYLNHPAIQGNKLRKLKYNLLAAKANVQTLVSFGGAYSNHIAALAAAGKAFTIPTVGIIRGEELTDVSRWSKTLQTADENGMQLHFVSRSAYRDKENAPNIATIIAQIPNAQLIPEGGSNALAVKGGSEVITELQAQLSPIDAIFTACGTGGTLAGLIDGAQTNDLNATLHGIAVLKGAHFLTDDITRLSQQHQHANWQLHFDYHHGGYAKTTAELHDVMTTFTSEHCIPLDPIYTGKLVFAVIDLAKKENHHPQNWVIYHSGGLR